MENFVADGIWIDLPPAKLFDKLLDPEVALEWLDADEASISPAVGGEFKIQRDTTTWSGEIAELRPGDFLRVENWTLQSPEGSRGPMELTMTLEARDTGTWFTVRQDSLDGQEGWQAYALAARKAWVQATVTLKRELEGI